MTAVAVLDYSNVIVKPHIYGKLVLQIESCVWIESIWLQINHFHLESVSGEIFVTNLHDWDICWIEEYEGKWFGELIIDLSCTFEDFDEDPLYKAKCSINELNVHVKQVTTNVGVMRVNDFSIEWIHVYSE